MKLPIIDCHCHIRFPENVGSFQQIADKLNLKVMNINCIYRDKDINDNPLGMLAKYRRPDLFRFFAGPDHSALLQPDAVTPSFPEQVETLLEIGADGMKILASKPTGRKHLGVAVDGDYFRPLFEALEQSSLPLLWHTADPEEFWDPQLTPGWAAEKGWGYDDSFPDKELLYQETENVLRRHPELKVILPHFYFLSADLPRAAALLEDFPNVCLDLAPGIELLYNLSKDPDASRVFFVKYSRRILFGTDAGMIPDAEENILRIETVGRFLETSDQFRLPSGSDFLLGPPEDGIIKGLDLPEETLRQICFLNFENIAGAQGRPLRADLAARECRRIAKRRIEDGGDSAGAEAIAAELEK
jgi:Amidohydrolase